MSEVKKIIVRCRAVILHNNKLLVVKHPHDTSFAALPGGHLEWDEGVLECLSREIKEELGVKPKIGKLLYVNNFLDGENTQSIEFFFEVINSEEYLNTEKLVRSHAHEISQILWVSPEDDIKILPRKFADDFKAGKISPEETKYIKG